MYNPIQSVIKYFKYYVTASSSQGHGMHSPFMFDFITNVLNDDRNFYAYNEIEKLRLQLLANETTIAIKDFGAGSKNIKNNQRKIAAIAASSLKPKKFSQLLFRMVNYYQPTTIIELGTSLGITTAYLASPKPDAKIITMEGAASIAAVALQGFQQLQLKNIQQVQGNFDDTLPVLINQLNSIDFAFIDGNHRYQPTINYFQQLLAKSNDATIIILDDIHWSKEMEQAWYWVQQHERVTATIDLFFIGIVLLCKDFKMKQHFSVRF